MLSALVESTDVITLKYVLPAWTVESTYCVIAIGAEFNFVYGPPDTAER